MSNLVSKVRFLNGYSLGTPRRLEIHEGIGEHELAIIEFPLKNIFGRLPTELTPVSIEWGRSPLNTRTFYGYVNHDETTVLHTGNSGAGTLRVVCLGASYSLNEPFPRSWNGATGSLIAAQVAKKHRMRAVVHTAKEVLPYWTTGQDSDFVMMNRLARHLGYLFWVSGTTLHLADPRRLLRAPGVTPVSLTMQGAKTDTLREYRVINGSLAPRDNQAVIKKVYGLDASGKMIRASSSQDLDDSGMSRPSASFVQSSSIGSLAEARRVTTAATRLGRWGNLHAVSWGQPKVRIGNLVQMTGNLVPSDVAGAWMVESAVHVMDYTQIVPEYVSDLTLTRNQADQMSFESQAALRAAPVDVSSVIRDGHLWQSEMLEVSSV